ncbi:hypothetical protein PG985_006366 [Apiospora marii]|uniref:Uncharacterized protein n=1 Tax=Apiospora marii TaxID=335849 RepID=A0ABR1S7D9_9PEZI
MRTLLGTITSVLALWVPITLAWDPSEKDCSDEPFCLTSFLWCGPVGSGCYYPEGVYPPFAHDTYTQFALVMANFNHTISWRKQAQYQDDPVTVRWRLGADVKWEINTTETQVTFRPERIVSDLYRDVVGEPLGGAQTNNSSYNVSDAVALCSPYNTMTNAFEIMLPAAAGSAGNYASRDDVPSIWSDLFIVASSNHGRYLDAQKTLGHKEEHKKWRLGVGIGVGLGVPLLMAATAWATWVAAKRRLGGKAAVAPTPPKD